MMSIVKSRLFSCYKSSDDDGSRARAGDVEAQKGQAPPAVEKAMPPLRYANAPYSKPPAQPAPRPQAPPPQQRSWYGEPASAKAPPPAADKPAPEQEQRKLTAAEKQKKASPEKAAAAGRKAPSADKPAAEKQPLLSGERKAFGAAPYNAFYATIWSSLLLLVTIAIVWFDYGFSAYIRVALYLPFILGISLGMTALYNSDPAKADSAAVRQLYLRGAAASFVGLAALNFWFIWDLFDLAFSHPGEFADLLMDAVPFELGSADFLEVFLEGNPALTMAAIVAVSLSLIALTVLSLLTWIPALQANAVIIESLKDDPFQQVLGQLYPDPQEITRRGMDTVDNVLAEMTATVGKRGKLRRERRARPKSALPFADDADSAEGDSGEGDTEEAGPGGA